MNAIDQCDRRWSTSSFDAPARMAGWNGIVAEHMTELNVTCEDPRSFAADWRQFALDPIELNFISAAPQLVRRTPQMVTRDGEPSYELVHMHRGSMVVREQGHEEFVAEGDFVLLRNAVPYEFECSESSMALTAHVTDSWLRQWLPDPHALRRVESQARMAWGGPLASLLLAISQRGLGDSALPRSVIADQVGSLLHLVAGGAVRQPSRGREATRRRVREVLARRFAEADLSPSDLAGDVGISLRYLHTLFADRGTTFGAELIEMRLQSAAGQLRANRSSSVSEIAFATGFADSSHFARRFRQRFGTSPSDWRRNWQHDGRLG